VRAARHIGLLLALAVCLTFFPGRLQAEQRGQSPYEQANYSHPFYREIVEEAKTKEPRDLIEFLERKIQEDPGRIHPVSLWLRDNTIGQRSVRKANSLYFMAYSDVMRQLALAYQKAGDNESYIAMTKTAVMSLYLFEMLATVDAIRCADPSVLAALGKNVIVPHLNGLSYAYRLLLKPDFDTFAKEAVHADDKFALRGPNAYICGLGDAKLADMLRQPGVVVFEAKNPATGDESQRVIPPRGYEYMPVFVTDTEWARRRPVAQQKVLSLWRTRYETLSAPQE
jgi:hypothetical protein